MSDTTALLLLVFGLAGIGIVLAAGTPWSLVFGGLFTMALGVYVMPSRE